MSHPTPIQHQLTCRLITEFNYMCSTQANIDNDSNLYSNLYRIAVVLFQMMKLIFLFFRIGFWKEEPGEILQHLSTLLSINYSAAPGQIFTNYHLFWFSWNYFHGKLLRNLWRILKNPLSSSLSFILSWSAHQKKKKKEISRSTRGNIYQLIFSLNMKKNPRQNENSSLKS